MTRLVALWHARSPSERRVLGVGFALVAIVFVVAFVWLPLERARTRLAVELPLMRASLSSLQQGAGEARRLRSMPATTATNPAQLSQLVAITVQSRDFAGAQVTAPDDKHVKLAGNDLGFTQLLDWLAQAQSAYGLVVESARIEALADPGRVRAELTLARS